MDQRPPEQLERATDPTHRAEWVKPEIVALDAGSAEVGDFATNDGNIAS